MAKIKISFLFIFIATPAFAYLDPGTGSMLIYFIIGIFATSVSLPLNHTNLNGIIHL